MDYQRQGMCGHIMATVDLHDICPGCRECFLLDNPCVVCDSLSPDHHQGFSARNGNSVDALVALAQSALRDRVNVDLWRGRALVLRGPL